MSDKREVPVQCKSVLLLDRTDADCLGDGATPRLSCSSDEFAHAMERLSPLIERDEELLSVKYRLPPVRPEADI